MMRIELKYDKIVDDEIIYPVPICYDTVNNFSLEYKKIGEPYEYCILKFGNISLDKRSYEYEENIITSDGHTNYHLHLIFFLMLFYLLIN